jgi:1,4-dihydroxy-2-naphthoyl-CoA hydrolase
MFRFEKATLVALPEGTHAESRGVRFQDVDAAGIVFYPRIIEYCHDAFAGFLERAGQPLSAALEARAWAAPIRHVEADFLRPLRFGQTVRVSLVARHLEPSEVVLGFQVRVEGVVHAVVQSVHTSVDLQSFQRVDFPEALRAVLSSVPEAG